MLASDTPFAGSSPFTPEYAARGSEIFLQPKPEYPWRDIVSGTNVQSKNGQIRRMFAVAPNTFRGFHRINQQCPGAKEEFVSYFRDGESKIVAMLRTVENREQLHHIADTLCSEIRDRLTNCKPSQLDSYNKLRKPVDLYLQHLTCMASELRKSRDNLVPLLFLPLDSQIVAHPYIFTVTELSVHRLTRQSTYKDIADSKSYNSLQAIVASRASQVSSTIHCPFHPIYFDLIWNNRFERWGGNLFEASP